MLMNSKNIEEIIHKLLAVHSCYTQLLHLMSASQSLIDIDKNKLNTINHNIDSAIIYLNHALDSLEELTE